MECGVQYRVGRTAQFEKRPSYRKGMTDPCVELLE